jgi:hypothetical protein
MDQFDQHMQEREPEKTADLESLADALATFRQLHRELDQWERVHLALGLAAVVSGCYGIGAVEAALALTPEIERMPKVKLPTDPIYERFDLALFERALTEVRAEPARRFPNFGRIEALDFRTRPRLRLPARPHRLASGHAMGRVTERRRRSRLRRPRRASGRRAEAETARKGI